LALQRVAHSRLVEIWNSFAGTSGFDKLKPVKKFTDRKAATTRIWAAVQKLEAAPAPQAPTPAPQAARKPAKKAKGTKAAKAAADAPQADASTPKVPREFSKKAIVRDLLVRTGGATLPEIMEKAGWQKHTVRGFISTLTKKTGIAITSTRRESDKARVYEAAK
jgi:ribonuclease D